MSHQTRREAIKKVKAVKQDMDMRKKQAERQREIDYLKDDIARMEKGRRTLEADISEIEGNLSRATDEQQRQKLIGIIKQLKRSLSATINAVTTRKNQLDRLESGTDYGV